MEMLLSDYNERCGVFCYLLIKSIVNYLHHLQEHNRLSSDSKYYSATDVLWFTPQHMRGVTGITIQVVDCDVNNT